MASDFNGNVCKYVFGVNNVGLHMRLKWRHGRDNRCDIGFFLNQAKFRKCSSHNNLEVMVFRETRSVTCNIHFPQ